MNVQHHVRTHGVATSDIYCVVLSCYLPEVQQPGVLTCCCTFMLSGTCAPFLQGPGWPAYVFQAPQSPTCQVQWCRAERCCGLQR